MSSPLFQLLRFSLGIVHDFPLTLTDRQWELLYEQAQQQTVVGVTYKGVERLRPEQMPPIDTAILWTSDAEIIRTLNDAFDEEARRQTIFFAKEGYRTAILKGQANARLYPDPKSRQPGDIDIWVEGGEEKIRTMLKEKRLMDDEVETFFHHVRLPRNEEGIEVEVHFRPSSCRNSKVQEYLIQELNHLTSCPEGFNIPSAKFALVMQLAHIRGHLFGQGIGLRHLIDYYMLLKSASCEERSAVSKQLKNLGLHRVAAALMWVLQETLFLDVQYMLIHPDSRGGRWMMDDVLERGNFGFSVRTKKMSPWTIFLKKKQRQWKQFYFEPERSGELWHRELCYWLHLFTRIPYRIKYRTLSLKDHPEIWKKEATHESI